MDHIIDGHNLISKMPGVSLDMPADEQRLIELLVGYCKLGGHRVEVFFDGAPVGQAGGRNYGKVRAYFVAQSQTADDAISKKLVSLGRAAKNWLVVSSDRSVQSAAREANAKVVGSEDFVRMYEALRQQTLQDGDQNTKPAADEPLSAAEVQEWEAIFKGLRKPK
jgi:predicted RNA-binding protein with PIN domain